jgi:hypothetical protein
VLKRQVYAVIAPLFRKAQQKEKEKGQQKAGMRESVSGESEMLKSRAKPTSSRPPTTHISLTAILPHTTRNTLTLVHINLTSTTLLSASSSTTAGINNAFLDIRGEREESLFHIDV